MNKLVILIPLLLVGGFLLVPPGEAVFYYVPTGEALIYYVTPTAPPNPDCPTTGKPCQTLEYYVTHTGIFFTVGANVTMLFLRGNHTVKDNSTELNVDFLTRLAMVGMHPAQEVVVCVNVILDTVSEVHIENMTYATTSVCQHPAISVMPTGNKIQKLSVINSYLKGSTLYLHQVPTIYRESTVDIDLANSTFTDGATVHIWLIRYSGTHGQPTNTIMKLTSCSFLNGMLLYITSYQTSSIVIEDCYIGMVNTGSRIAVRDSSVVMSGHT